jgi:ribonuclease Y
MEAIIALLSALVALGIGAGAGYVLQGKRLNKTLTEAQAKAVQAESQAAKVVQEAEAQKRTLIQQAEEDVRQQRARLETELREWRNELQRQERRVANREESLDRRAENLERRERNLAVREQDMEQRAGELEEIKKQQLKALESVAGLSVGEAKELVLHRAEEDSKQELAKQFYDLQQRYKEESELQGRRLLVESIQRLASDVVAESTVTVVPLPNDEMKGRLIGREGRNIRAIEQATGVDLIIDDTPEAVTISCFDPIRREIARLTLSKLISDGRVHPGRIEETVEKSRQEVERVVWEAGERAALEAGVTGLHPELVRTLGRLYFRTSYGQNVLKHSIEMSFVGAMLAAEVGANVEIVRAGALLHDIGKALTHEVDGPHAEIGAELAQKHSVPEPIRVCIKEHHDNTQSTLESAIVQAADAVSAARPGARRDTLERYAKRLEELEAVVNGFPGIEKTYAIQAGREVRIIVKPEEVDDVSAANLARDVAKRIQEKLAYPGQIKVVVIRETRSSEFAR